MAEKEKVVRKYYNAKNGKTYQFKEKHLGARWRFPGNSKAFTSENAIENAEAMERLIKSNDKKIEEVAGENTASIKANDSTKSTAKKTEKESKKEDASEEATSNKK